MFKIDHERPRRQRRRFWSFGFGRSKSGGRGNKNKMLQSAQSLPAMPHLDEVQARFESVLKKMDLPPDKARVLRAYDLAKKWEMVCDQERVTEQAPPSFYLDKIRAFMERRKGTKRKKKALGDETSTMVLKHLETSLRTNSIDWVRTFLDGDNVGLDVLINYLSLIQESGGLLTPPHLQDDSAAAAGAQNVSQNGDISAGAQNVSANLSSSSSILRRKAAPVQRSRSMKLMGVPEDDIHVCIQCLRAIMNNKIGFNMVFSDSEAIYCIVRSILHHSLRTRALVLELLAAICLVKGGHELIINAFDRFKVHNQEDRRFRTLVTYFRAPVEFHVDFMVACMQFVNIVVHSVEDMNYRIYLQYEFQQLGLDEYLETTLRLHESEPLLVQISAYMENTFDAGQLLEESELKSRFEHEASDLRVQLSAATERCQEMEADYMVRLAHLDSRMSDLVGERDRLLDLHRRNDTEMNTLKRTLTLRETQSKQQQSELENRIQELERLQQNFRDGLQAAQHVAPPSPPPPPPTMHSNEDRSDGGAAVAATSAPPPPPPPPPPAPPPPPPLPPGMLFGPAGEAMTIKRRIQTKYKLPQLNWTVLKPNEVKDTVFNDLDDDRVISMLDFSRLEDLFKLGSNPTKVASHDQSDGSNDLTHTPVASKKHESLLDMKRLRNVAITKRKLAMDANSVMVAVHRFDLTALPLENVDILLRILPSAEEIKSYKEYESSQKPVDLLSDEDRFVMQLCKIERLGHKLQIMSVMGNFTESAALLDPQFTTLTAASKSVREATKFHKVLEIVLAFGNYVNSSRRGGAYGFRIQSLDALAYMKCSSDKSVTLLHMVADAIRQRFPELLDFTAELKFADKASAVSLETVQSDMAELERGYELARKEQQLKHHDAPPTLAHFVDGSAERMQRLKDNARISTEAFRVCVEFYGETTKSANPASFFGVLAKFSKGFQTALQENIEREKAEQRNETKKMKRSVDEAARREERRRSKAAATLEAKTAAVIDELQSAQFSDGRPVVARKGAKAAASKRDPTQIGHGDIDEIIKEMRGQPFKQQAPAKRRSGGAVASASPSLEHARPPGRSHSHASETAI